MDTVRVFIGYDPRESVAYHVCCESILNHASVPVSFHPLSQSLLAGFNGQRDGTNAFTYSRYLVPYLCDYKGWALFIDGDMTVNVDIAELWSHRPLGQALAVVKHDYVTKHPRKYVGSRLENDNLDYPRKNWSSVVLWNCAHYGNRRLDPAFCAAADPKTLHRFEWLADEAIGELQADWNHLIGEYPPASPYLSHYTLGVPGIKHYADDNGSWRWHHALLSALRCAGEDPVEMVARSQTRVGDV